MVFAHTDKVLPWPWVGSWLLPNERSDWTYLSFAALMTTGSMVWQVTSLPTTGARREMAYRTVIRYR